jgi:hypothetical protein
MNHLWSRIRKMAGPIFGRPVIKLPQMPGSGGLVMAGPMVGMVMMPSLVPALAMAR